MWLFGSYIIHVSNPNLFIENISNATQTPSGQMLS